MDAIVNHLFFSPSQVTTGELPPDPAPLALALPLIPTPQPLAALNTVSPSVPTPPPPEPVSMVTRSTGQSQSGSTGAFVCQVHFLFFVCVMIVEPEIHISASLFTFVMPLTKINTDCKLG